MDRKLVNKVVFVIIALATLFIIIYKHNHFPPALIYDQITPFIALEIVQTGEVEMNTRSQIFHHLNLITPFYKLIPQFRSVGELDNIDLIIKLPAMLMMFVTSITWWGILTELKFSLRSRVLFSIIFLTSPFFILYSKYLAIIAGYLMYNSLFLYFLVKALLYKGGNRRFLLYFSTSILFGIAAFYTQIASIVFILIFYISSLVIFTPKELVARFKTFKSQKVGFSLYVLLIIVAMSIIIVVGSMNFINPEKQISDRSSTTIFSSLSETTPLEFVEDAFNRTKAYLDPRYLVTGSNQFVGTDGQHGFTQFINHNDSIWLIQRASPFGIISIAVYITVLLYFLREKKAYDLKWNILISLFLAFLGLSIIGNYDNPNTARVIPGLMFVPLGIIISYEFLSKKSAGKKITTLTLNIATLLLIFLSGLVSINLYTENYTNQESHKFSTGYKEISNQILKSTDLSNIRIYHNNNFYSSERFLEIYLGPSVVNRVVKYNDSQYFNSYPPLDSENNYFVTTESKDLDLIPRFKDMEFIVEKHGSLYLGFYDTTDIEKVDAFIISDTTYSTQSLAYDRSQEFDILNYEYPIYKYLGDKKVYTSSYNNSSTKLVNYTNVSTFNYFGNTLTLKTDLDGKDYTKTYRLEPNIIGTDETYSDKTNGVIESKSGLHFEAEVDSATYFIHIPQTNASVYLYTFETTTDEKSLTISFYDNTESKFIEGYMLDNKTYITNITKGNHLIVNLTKPQGLNTKIQRVRDVELRPVITNEFNSNISTIVNREARSMNRELEKITTDGLRFRAKGICDITTVVLNKPYNPNWVLLIDGKRTDYKPELINGYVIGWTVNKESLCNSSEIEFKYIEI